MIQSEYRQRTASWNALIELAERASAPSIDPGAISEYEWLIIERTLNQLLVMEDWNGILQLRQIFNSLYASDSMTGLAFLQQLDQQAIKAARLADNKQELAHLLGAQGHNLHRQGFHQRAIEAFEESAKCYQAIGQARQSLENYYMTSLCQRALGDRRAAKKILQNVLEQTPPNDPWRAHPLQVLSWLTQDQGDLPGTEALLRQSLALFRVTQNSDMLIAGALADLGEVVGILGRTQEAKDLFEESLSMFSPYKGQYNRQEARTALKYAELLMHQKDYRAVERILNQADDSISRYGHYYDLLWQIELARAFVFLRTRRLSFCLRKIQSAFRIRRHLELSNVLLVQHIIKRYFQRFIQPVLSASTAKKSTPDS